MNFKGKIIELVKTNPNNYELGNKVRNLVWPEVIKELKKYQREDIMVIVGGVIPKQDYAFLKQEGVTAIFGPGTKISETAKTILTILLNK